MTSKERRKSCPRKASESNRKWELENPDKARKMKRDWQRNNPQKVRESRERWLSKNPEVRYIVRKAWHDNNPEKVAAHQALYYAIKHGKVIKPDTCSCGRPNPQGHHPDYSKPLMVMWLCDKCHKILHIKE